jgi:hypothetical protein
MKGWGGKMFINLSHLQLRHAENFIIIFLFFLFSPLLDNTAMKPKPIDASLGYLKPLVTIASRNPEGPRRKFSISQTPSTMHERHDHERKNETSQEQLANRS